MKNRAASIAAIVLVSLNAAAFEKSVPTFDFSNVQPGATWIWDYFSDDRGQETLYSTERYEVIKLSSAGALGVGGEQVTIEMSTELSGEKIFTPHNRIVANVHDCKAAYRNPSQKKPWYLAMFNLDNGKWVPYEADSTLAFEEKFNCDGFFHDHTGGLTTIARTISAGEVFQHARTIEGPQAGRSWYLLTGPQAGLAAEKKFGASVGPTYNMRLRTVSRPTNP